MHTKCWPYQQNRFPDNSRSLNLIINIPTKDPFCMQMPTLKHTTQKARPKVSGTGNLPLSSTDFIPLYAHLYFLFCLFLFYTLFLFSLFQSFLVSPGSLQWITRFNLPSDKIARFSRRPTWINRRTFLNGFDQRNSVSKRLTFTSYFFI